MKPLQMLKHKLSSLPMPALVRLERARCFLFLISFSLLLNGCGARQDDGLRGVVNVWHSWNPEQAAVLNQVLASFTDIHPDVTVRTTVIPREQLRSQFELSARSGLGPDLLFGPSSWIMPLADAKLILPIQDLIPEEVWGRFLPATAETIQYQGRNYGLPESLRLSGLYYNRRSVSTPATTLDQLVEEAKQGARVGMSPEFLEAFWGVQAFGGQLFAEEDERVILDDGGFANWLSWLNMTLDIPNIVLDKDSETLLSLFAEGELAYLVAGSWRRDELQAAMGEEILGVAPLPSGPIREAGPFLETDALMFSVASSFRQRQIAAELATFITNSEQQTVLMRRAGRIPTNILVRNNPSIDPIAHAFRVQARTAVPLRNSHGMDAVLEMGDDAYNRALQGVAEPIVIASNLTRAINSANGYAEIEEVANPCGSRGVIAIAYDKALPAPETLFTIAENYQQLCAGVRIDFQAQSLAEISAILGSDESEVQPHALLLPNTAITPLVMLQLIKPLNGFIDTQQLQIYHPKGVEAMRFAEQIYGLPYLLMPQALSGRGTDSILDRPDRSGSGPGGRLHRDVAGLFRGLLGHHCAWRQTLRQRRTCHSRSGRYGGMVDLAFRCT